MAAAVIVQDALPTLSAGWDFMKAAAKETCGAVYSDCYYSYYYDYYYYYYYYCCCYYYYYYYYYYCYYYYGMSLVFRQSSEPCPSCLDHPG